MPAEVPVRTSASTVEPFIRAAWKGRDFGTSGRARFIRAFGEGKAKTADLLITQRYIYMLFVRFPQRRRPPRRVIECQSVPTLVFLTVCTKNRQPLHLFASPSGEGLDFDTWVSKWKALLSRTYKRLGYRWQSGCFHHRIRGYESAESKWKYIQHNPVRAGLASAPELWPYQGQIFKPRFWY